MGERWFGSVIYVVPRTRNLLEPPECYFPKGGLELGRRYFLVEDETEKIWSPPSLLNVCVSCLKPPRIGSDYSCLFCPDCWEAHWVDRPVTKCRRRTLAQPKRKSKRLRKIDAAASATEKDLAIESITPASKAGVATSPIFVATSN